MAALLWGLQGTQHSTGPGESGVGRGCRARWLSQPDLEQSQALGTSETVAENATPCLLSLCTPADRRFARKLRTLEG